MDIRFLIEQLDEISRRGFLTGLAATGAAGYYGKQELEKSGARKKERSQELLNVYDINAGDSKDTVARLLGKPDKDMDSGPYTFWNYSGPYLNSDPITITFGNSRSSWGNVDGRVVQVEVGVKQTVRMDDAFALRDKKFDDEEANDEEAKLKQKADDIAKKFSPLRGAGPDDWKLEEDSDEAIARIVELSKK